MKKFYDITYFETDQCIIEGLVDAFGYAVFKQVEILCESEEYYIIEEGNSYGLSNYDHIALDGASVRENDIVSQ